jgi:hypothetical protein
MRLIMVNFQHARDVRFFDPSTGMLEKQNECSWKDADGRFSQQDGSLVCLFQSRGILHLYLDGTTITVDSDLITGMDEQAHERRFRAFRGARVIYDKTYPRRPNTDANPFWPSDAEDEDIFLWIHNIVGSPERQLVLLESSRRQ